MLKAISKLSTDTQLRFSAFSMSLWLYSILLIIILLAFALRVYRLDYQSVWHDEGYSIYQAQHLLDPSPEARKVFDTDRVPPFHPVLLRGWLTLTGTSEFVLRYFSLICGVLTVALCYKLAARLADRTTGAVAAIIAAFSPFYIYYSQEIRSYVLLLLWALLSAYAFTRLFRARYTHWWLVYILAETFSIYTHFTSIALVAAKNLFVVLYLLTRRGVSIANGAGVKPAATVTRGALLKRWLISQVALGLLFLPIYILTPTKELLRASSITFTWLKLQNVLAETISTFNGAPNIILATGLGGFLIAGVILPMAEHRRAFMARFYLSIYILVPIIAAVVYLQKPGQFAGKFLIAVSPAYYTLIARGMMESARWLGKIRRELVVIVYSITIILFGINLVSLWSYYSDPLRPDFRGAIRYISQRARPNDIVILCAPYFYPTFQYYNEADLEWRGIPRTIPLDEAATAAELREIIESYDRVWLLLWQNYYPDPDGFIIRWLNDNADDKTTKQFTDVKVQNFATGRFIYTDIPDIEHRQQANLGNIVRFLGYDLDRGSARPGENIEITLYWETIAPMDINYTVFTHLIDDDNRSWGGRDGWPIDGGYPTKKWELGEIIRDAYAIPIAVDAPPGEYRVEVGMYNLETMERLPVLDDANNPVDTRIVIEGIEILAEGE